MKTNTHIRTVNPIGQTNGVLVDAAARGDMGAGIGTVGTGVDMDGGGGICGGGIGTVVDVLSC